MRAGASGRQRFSVFGNPVAAVAVEADTPPLKVVRAATLRKPQASPQRLRCDYRASLKDSSASIAEV